MKKYKWWIVGLVVIALVGLIIGLTVGKSSDDKPNPPGPTPINVYNPYTVDSSSVVTKT
jgi:sugar phosphate permease